MRRFNPDEPCPKCGSSSKTVKFSAATTGVYSGQLIPEQISASCVQCGYVEMFRPLDAPKEEPCAPEDPETL